MSVLTVEPQEQLNTVSWAEIHTVEQNWSRDYVDGNEHTFRPVAAFELLYRVSKSHCLAILFGVLDWLQVKRFNSGETPHPALMWGLGHVEFRVYVIPPRNKKFSFYPVCTITWGTFSRGAYLEEISSVIGQARLDREYNREIKRVGLCDEDFGHNRDVTRLESGAWSSPA